MRPCEIIPGIPVPNEPERVDLDDPGPRHPGDRDERDFEHMVEERSGDPDVHLGRMEASYERYLGRT